MALTKQTIQAITNAQNMAKKSDTPLKEQLDAVFNALKTSRLNDKKVMAIVEHCNTLTMHGIPSQQGLFALQALIEIRDTLPASEPEVWSTLGNMLYACCFILVIATIALDIAAFFLGEQPGFTAGFFMWIDTPSSSAAIEPTPAINVAMSSLTSTASALNTQNAVPHSAPRGRNVQSATPADPAQTLAPTKQ